MSTDARCGVCGRELTTNALEPPTFSMQEVPGSRPGVVRPVLSKPVRMDPATGAVCWCEPSDSAEDERYAAQQEESTR